MHCPGHQQGESIGAHTALRKDRHSWCFLQSNHHSPCQPPASLYKTAVISTHLQVWGGQWDSCKIRPDVPESGNCVHTVWSTPTTHSLSGSMGARLNMEG